MTREKAIEVVKSATVYTPKEMEALETLIPELLESEDERIRKGLIDIFNSALGQDFLQRKAGLDRDKVIAYLEKQKEQNPAEIDEEHKVGKWFTGLIPCWIDAPSTLQPAHSYHGKNVIAIHEKSGGYRCCCVDDEKPTTFHVAEDTHLVEGWKDRKPAEWSEEDSYMLSRIIYDVQARKDHYEDAGNKVCVKECEKEIDWLENRLKSLRPSWKPSKEQPVEGLEEKDFVEEVRQYYSNNCTWDALKQPMLSIITRCARHFAEWGKNNLK